MEKFLTLRQRGALKLQAVGLVLVVHNGKDFIRFDQVVIDCQGVSLDFVRHRKSDLLRKTRRVIRDRQGEVDHLVRNGQNVKRAFALARLASLIILSRSH